MNRRKALRRLVIAAGALVGALTAPAIHRKVFGKILYGREDLRQETPQQAGALLEEEMIVSSPADANDNHEELMLAAHPEQAGILIGSAFIVFQNSTSKKSANAYVSTDSGRTWAKSPNAAFVGDPIVAVTRRGTLFFAGINSASSGGLIYHRSIDNGRTWSSAANTVLSVDFPKVAVDYTDGTYSGYIYVTGRAPDDNLYVFRSTDDGITFTSSLAVPRAGKAFAYNPLVLHDGTLFIGWQTEKRILSKDGVYAGSSADHYSVLSYDGGLSFGPSRKIFTQSRIPNVIGGSIPVYGVGKVGGVERIYVLVSDTSDSNGRLRLWFSEDRGATWSPPRDVIPGVPQSVAHAQASLMINSAGVIGIAWIQVTEGNLSYNIYFTYSVDGGTNFATPIQVSRDTSHPPEVSYRYPGGDYMYSTAAADCSFHIFWPDARSGLYQIYTRRITVNAGCGTIAKPTPSATASPVPSRQPMPTLTPTGVPSPPPSKDGAGPEPRVFIPLVHNSTDN